MAIAARLGKPACARVRLIYDQRGWLHLRIVRIKDVSFASSWFIRIGGMLVVVTSTLLLILSIAAFVLHYKGPLVAVALWSDMAGSIGMMLLCLGAIHVLMRRRRIE
jgi:hypothetical protein